MKTTGYEEKLECGCLIDWQPVPPPKGWAFKRVLCTTHQLNSLKTKQKEVLNDAIKKEERRRRGYSR